MLNRFEKLLYDISEIDRYWHKIAADEMERYGLKGPYAVYLTALYRHPEGVTAAQLAELCSRDKADVSRVAAALEARGLVCREVGQSVYRAPLRLTMAGRTVAAEVCKRVALAVELGGKGLTDAQRETMWYALDLIAGNLRALSEQGMPAAETEPNGKTE